MSVLSLHFTVALSYAKDRNFDNNTQNVIFYDIGSTGTKAALVTFQSIADVKAKKNKTIGMCVFQFYHKY